MAWSDYFLAGGIAFAFIIVTFLLLIFMPKPKSYFDIDDVAPELNILTQDEYFTSIKNELTEWVTNTEENSNLHIIHYANDTLVDSQLIPNTFDILQTIPDIASVFVAKVNKKTEITQRKGSADYANNTLRCILPISISGEKKSGIWNDGETKLFVEKELIIHDDSRPNSVFNKHKRKDTILLIIDVERPSRYPAGIALENHDVLF